jgi:hypothetical protein
MRFIWFGLLLLLACDAQVAIDEPTAGGAGSGGSAPAAPTAVAATRAQLGLEGSGLDPNDLFVRASSAEWGCDDELILPCGGSWAIDVGLPIAYQQVGIYDLDDPALFVFYGESLELNDPSSDEWDCPGGGGGMHGTIEVLAIDSAAVRFRVEMDDVWELDPSGEYLAPRCP